MIADRLRKAVIEAAIKGNITNRLSNDENIENLIKKLKQEKDNKVKNKEIRRKKLKGVPSEEEVPYEIPNHWVYLRLGELGDFKKGPFGSALTKSIFVKDSADSIKVYEQKNAIQKSENLGEYFISNEYYEQKMSGFTVRGGDLIISCAGTIGETFILPDNSRIGIINQALMRVRLHSQISKDFFKYLFEYVLNSKGDKKGKGSAIKNIPPFEILLNFVVGLPPIEEQKRIVKKLDELLPLIDSLEKDELKLKELMQQFPDKMRDSILQAAMEGRITEQLSEDGSTIQEVTSLSITDMTEDLPFDIPENWQWVTFGDIVEYKMGKTPPREKSEYWGKGYNWISIADMRGKGLVENTTESVTTQAISDIFRNNISPKGTLIMSFKLTVGRVTFLGIDAVHNEAIISIYPKYGGDILKQYLAKILPMVTKLGDTKDAIKGKTLNSKSISKLLIPLPPLAEQRRIVEKLNQILPLVETIST